MENLKFVFVGDGGVGKSSLLITYSTGKFPSNYVPTVFDNYVIDLQHGNESHAVALFDTAGQEDYDRLRSLSYSGTDVFLICFSVNSRNSFCNVSAKWMPEIKRFCTKTPVLLVGCKSDFRIQHPDDCIPADEIEKEARELGAKYVETSSLRDHQLKYCFQVALSLGLGCKASSTKNYGKLFGKKKLEPVAPVMPPAGLAPVIDIQTSVFGDEWKAMVERPKYADVVFVTASEHRFKAHRVVLCSASEIFCSIFIKNTRIQNQLEVGKENIKDLCREEICSGRVLGFKSIRDEEVVEDGFVSTQTVIELSADISASAFANVLQFLYSGLPKVNSESSIDEIDEVLTVAQTFQLTYLQEVCKNIQRDEHFLNPSIGTYLNDKMGEQLKDLFFNKQHFADVTFIVEGTEVFAHRAVLCARCDVMQAMFSSNFVEGSSSKVELPDVALEPFLAFLEFIYTDHAPIEDGDSVYIMALAGQYFLKRLVTLCELYITKEVDRSVVKNIKESEVDVIGLLLSSQLHNADQLEKWCLHFIASNYLAFIERTEFTSLTGDNLAYVEKNRWPPLSYLDEVKDYEAQMKNFNPKACCVM